MSSAKASALLCTARNQPLQLELQRQVLEVQWFERWLLPCKSA